MGIFETFVALAFIAAIQVGFNIAYLLFMKRAVRRPWNVKIDSNYRPQITIIVPTYNEAEVIEMKLQNLNLLKYPEDKLEVIVVDSASTDGTLDVCRQWLTRNSFRFKIILLSEPIRISKLHALNYALKHANGEIIVVTDADAILVPDILVKAIPYLADPDVGAISGRENIVNASACFVAKMENAYRDIYYMLRLGESKIHSTQIFQGEFAAYKRSLLEFFTEAPGRSDDNGAVTEILRKGKRCLLVPEAVFYDAVACNLIDYLKVKIRRATHLQREFLIRFKLWVKGELKIPKFILLANVYQHFANPLIFMFSIPLALYFLIELSKILPLLSILLILAITIVSIVARHLIALYIISNFILIVAFIRTLILSKRQEWEAVRSSRRYLKVCRQKLDTYENQEPIRFAKSP
ncbi:MAG: glycosyltransferase [Desulfurococcaceae archaeon]